VIFLSNVECINAFIVCSAMKYFVRNKFGLREYNYHLSKTIFFILVIMNNSEVKRCGNVV